MSAPKPEKLPNWNNQHKQFLQKNITDQEYLNTKLPQQTNLVITNETNTGNNEEFTDTKNLKENDEMEIYKVMTYVLQNNFLWLLCCKYNFFRFNIPYTI